jgi:hypothetical protein
MKYVRTMAGDNVRRGHSLSRSAAQGLCGIAHF